MSALASLVASYRRQSDTKRLSPPLSSSSSFIPLFFLSVPPQPDMWIDGRPLFSQHRLILLMGCQPHAQKFDSTATRTRKRKGEKKRKSMKKERGSETKSPTIYYAVCASTRCRLPAIYFLPWGSDSHFSTILSRSLSFFPSFLSFSLFLHPVPLLTKLLPPATESEHHRSTASLD